MELQVPQGLWPQRRQAWPALDVVPQEQQDHMAFYRDVRLLVGLEVKLAGFLMVVLFGWILKM